MFKRLLRFLVISVAVYLAFNRIISSFQNQPSYISSFLNYDCVEESITDSITNDRLHTRAWNMIDSYDGFCKSFFTQQQQMLISEKARKEVVVYGEDYAVYWGKLYRQLVDQDYYQIQFLADSLYDLAVEKDFGEREFASLVVSFIQDIPYSYIKPDECPDTNKPCKANVRFGIFSPYEFLHTMSGDCDTRAVLLFAMFDYLGYDPMIVISDNYLHAMLALNIQSSGDYISHDQKKYYFWETTAKGWDIGILPPSYSNVDYWKVALVN